MLLLDLFFLFRLMDLDDDDSLFPSPSLSFSRVCAWEGVLGGVFVCHFFNVVLCLWGMEEKGEMKQPKNSEKEK